MSPTLVLVLVTAGSYLAAHLAFEWIGRRYLIVSGAEYLLLGVLLGPSVTGLIRPEAAGGLAPLMTLALGWIGAVIGAQFVIPNLVRIPADLFRVALAESVLAFALVSLVTGAALVWVLGVPAVVAAPPALALGAVATASAPSGIGLVSGGRGRQDALILQLQVSTAVDAAVAIVAFGLLLAIVHETPAVTPRAPTATEWVVISIGIGVVGGALFHLFLGGERQIDRLFVALAGAIILASGAAAYLRLSPLLPTMLIGMLLVNTTSNREGVLEVLGRVERPLYFVLLIFAGAAWEPASAVGAAAGVALLFLGVRTAAKLVAAPVAAATADRLAEYGGGWGRALLGQGGLAVAIALNYRLHEELPFGGVVFTSALVSVLVMDLVSARLASGVLAGRGGPRRAAPARVD